MVTLSQADAKRIRLEADTPSALTNLTDLEWNFYSPQSGLVPASKYSITDHKMAYYKLQGNYSGSIRDVETAFFKAQGAVGNSYDEVRYDFYANRQFFLPSALAGLELWLASDNISGAVLASDGFDRSKNLWAVGDPSFEANTSVASGQASATLTRDVATSHSGTASWKIVTPGAAAFNEGVTLLGSVAGFNGATVVAGRTYTASYYCKGNAGGEQVVCQIRWADINNALISGSQSAVFTLTTGWNRITVTAAAPAGAVFATGKVLTAVAAALTYWVDDVQLQLGSMPTAFVWGDATHLGTTDQGQAWQVPAGTAGVAAGAATLTAGNIAYVDTGTVDQTISLDATIGEAGQSLSPLIRGIDASNFIFARYFQNTDALEIYKMDAGIATQLATSSALGLSLGVSLCAVISAVGNLISLTATRLDNGVVSSVNVTLAGADAVKYTGVTATRVGWRSNNTGQTFDNFLVKAPVYSDGASLPVWADKSGYARHALQTNTAKQPLLRSANSNLLTYNQATAEIDTTDFFFFQTGGTATVAHDATTASQGTGSTKFTITAAGAGNSVLYVAEPSGNSTPVARRIPVIPGGAYSFTIDVKGSAARLANCTVSFYDSSGTFLSSQTGPSTAITIGAFTSYIATNKIVPANAVYCTVGVAIAGVVVADVFWIDKLGAFVGSSLPSQNWLPPVNLPSTGKAAVQFDGLDDLLATLVAMPPGDNTVYAVSYYEGGQDGYTVGGNNIAGATPGGLGSEGSGTGLRLRTGGSNISRLTTSLVGGWHTVGGVFATGASAVIVDGGITTGVLPAGNPFSDEAPQLGGRSAGGLPILRGNIAAVLVFSRALTLTERQSVERFLKNKYGTP